MTSVMNVSLKEIKSMLITALKAQDKSMRKVTEDDITVEVVTPEDEVVAVKNIRFSVEMGS